MKVPRDSGDPLSSLALSVGSASLPVRLLIFIVLGAVSLALFGSAVHIAGSGIAEALLSVLLIAPAATIALLLAFFALAPRSRYGRAIDNGRTAAAWTVLAGWAAGIIAVLMGRG
jgi:hypothetical protein